jgi:hypothetical protein
MTINEGDRRKDKKMFKMYYANAYDCAKGDLLGVFNSMEEVIAEIIRLYQEELEPDECVIVYNNDEVILETV